MHSTSENHEERTLARYLRQHPASLTWPTEKLAEAAGVRPEIAQLAGGNELKKMERSRTRSVMPGWLKRVLEWLDPLTADPIATTGVSTVFIGVCAIVLRMNESTPSPLLGLTTFLIIVSCLGLQMASYARDGRLEKAIQGTVTFAVEILFLMLLQELIARPPDVARSEVVGLVIGITVFACIGHLSLGLVFAASGGFIRMQRADQDLQSLSRFDLLTRYLDLQDRLEKPPDQVKSARPEVSQLQFIAAYTKNPYWVALAAGGAFSLLLMLVPGSAELTSNRDNDVSAALLVVASVTFMLSTICQIGLAFFARGIAASMLVSVCFSLGSTLVSLIPINGYGWEPLKNQGVSGWIAVSAFTLAIGLIGGLGGAVRERSAQAKMVRDNDPLALLSESIQIQRLLTPVPKLLTVMVVDAFQSSVMKAEANPFEAEWSFRAYQMLLFEIATPQGGQLFSTAGDGATFIFEDPVAALATAHLIQMQLKEFNARVNRLPRPFRVRIGLHTGQVAGFIEDVEYSSVIDIAAHIEKACRVDAIALSGSTYDIIKPAEAELQNLLVDHQQIYIIPEPAV